MSCTAKARQKGTSSLVACIVEGSHDMHETPDGTRWPAYKTERVYPVQLTDGDVINFGGSYAVIKRIERVRSLDRAQLRYQATLTFEEHGGPFPNPVLLSPYTKIVRKTYPSEVKGNG